jgi:pyrroloquinoline quinone (PQQ) biosynthesis protein C
VVSTSLGLAAFSARVAETLDNRRVSRDNPTHARLLAGGFTRAELHALGTQMWLFHRAFPGSLALAAGQCPTPEARARVLRVACDQEFGSGGIGRLAQWARVCQSLGLSERELRAARPTLATDAMLAIQELMGRRPAADGVLGLMVGVLCEVAPFLSARRQAMADHYGVFGLALDYFGESVEDPFPGCVALAHELAPGALEQDAALRALRLVLEARWDFFDALAAPNVDEVTCSGAPEPRL